MLKLLTFRCTRRSEAGAHSDHFLLHINNGGRRPKTSGADVRAKVTAMTADARRYPASARRGIPGAPRSTCYRMLARPPRPKAPGPIEPDALGAFEASRGGCGARRLKVALERSGIVASRRRICRIMREDGLSSSCSGRAPKGGDRPVRPPSAENVLARSFDGRAPRTHVASDPACVRAGGSRRCVRPLVDLAAARWSAARAGGARTRAS